MISLYNPIRPKWLQQRLPQALCLLQSLLISFYWQGLLILRGLCNWSISDPFLRPEFLRLMPYVILIFYYFFILFLIKNSQPLFQTSKVLPHCAGLAANLIGYYSLFSIHYSPFTILHSLFTTIPH